MTLKYVTQNYYFHFFITNKSNVLASGEKTQN